MTNRERVDEELRILRAAAAGAIHTNGHGRWVIDQQPRPNRKAREGLLRRGYVTYAYLAGRSAYQLTGAGRAMLDEHDQLALTEEPDHG